VQPLKNFLAFYGTRRRFLTTFTWALYWSLTWARPIHSTPHHIISSRSILISFTHLFVGLPSGLFHSGFPTNNLYMFVFTPICATCPAHIILRDLINVIILAKGKNHDAPRYAVFSALASPYSSSVRMSSSAPCSQTSSVYIPPLMSEIKFHINIEPQAKL
jgi:hypothetical protein